MAVKCLTDHSSLNCRFEVFSNPVRQMQQRSLDLLDNTMVIRIKQHNVPPQAQCVLTGYKTATTWSTILTMLKVCCARIRKEHNHEHKNGMRHVNSLKVLLESSFLFATRPSIQLRLLSRSSGEPRPITSSFTYFAKAYLHSGNTTPPSA